MKPRSKAAKVRKARRRKTVRSKVRSKPTRRRGRRLSTAELEEQLDLRTRELAQAREQQAATSEVLRVIASSPGELQPVFEAILANAMRICEARFGHLVLYDGEGFHGAYLHDVPPAYRELWERGPVRPGPKTGIRRLADTKQVVHVADIAAEPAYAERDPLRVATVDIAGARTFLGVPMLKEKELVGAIIIYRQEVRPVYRQANRNGLRALLPKPLSPSRTRVCSTSCAIRCSSRPPPPKCSRSSADPPSICRRCSIR